MKENLGPPPLGAGGPLHDRAGARSRRHGHGLSRRFAKAKPEIVARHLETLAILGELRRSEDGRYHEVLQPA